MTFSVQDHVKLHRVSSIAVSIDGAWLAVVVERLDRDSAKYVSDLWKVPTDGGAPVQLTRRDTKDTTPCFRQDHALGFLSNRHPTEIETDDESDKRMQVWILPANGGEPQQLTDEPLGVEEFRFADDADRLVLFAPVLPDVEHGKQRQRVADHKKKGPNARHFTEQPVRHWDHWLHENTDLPNTHLIAYSADGRNRVDLTPDAKREFAIEPELDVSSDGRLVAVIRQRPGEDRVIDQTILLVDIATSAQTILGDEPRVTNEQLHFSPDGTTLALVRSVRSPELAPRPTLTLIDVATGDVRTPAADWSLLPHVAGWSPDGKHLIVTADNDGDVPVYTIDRETGEARRVTSPSSGGVHSDIVAIPDGRLAGIRSTLIDAPECFVVESAQDSTPTTLARLSGFPTADWAEVERCSAPSTDGVDIQFFVLKPKGVTTPLPTLLWIHGGPIGMSADGWHWRWNPLLGVAAGYAVVTPNPRGSTGFGQDFIQGIWGNVWGDQCYKDLMAVTDALEQRSDIDEGRIMAMGGSFGGYMSNWIGTQTDRFRCLITHASIFTIAQFTGVTDHPPWWYLEMGGEDPYADQSSFDRYAPVQHIKNWKTPTLIIHGERDYRCPLSEGLNLFEALRYHDVDAELLIFPDENHWILKPQNAIVWYETLLAFLERHMNSGTET